jgi:hypothetical protein
MPIGAGSRPELSVPVRVSMPGQLVPKKEVSKSVKLSREDIRGGRKYREEGQVVMLPDL